MSILPKRIHWRCFKLEYSRKLLYQAIKSFENGGAQDFQNAMNAQVIPPALHLQSSNQQIQIKSRHMHLGPVVENTGQKPTALAALLFPISTQMCGSLCEPGASELYGVC